MEIREQRDAEWGHLPGGLLLGQLLRKVEGDSKAILILVLTQGTVVAHMQADF